ncbi:hypothetical protein MTP04_24540 [Lysinibacillus sp. PLM2]|nr:hypothetical protein MTP04_24540 [Lysinibacillus sp. PLM2]
MTSLAVKRQFNKTYTKFLNNEAKMKDVSKLILLVRENKNTLSESQIKDILEIPQSVLEENVVLKKHKKDESLYFANNGFINSQIPQVAEIGERFLKGDYDNFIFVEILEFCRNNISDVKPNIEYWLRNPEVALRDDVIEVRWQTEFEQDQSLFASILKRVLEL